MKIYIIGIGPGGTRQMTPRASDALKECDSVVGYSKYIALIRSLISGKKIYTSGMMHEAERCKMALDYALEGDTVALVSDGDAGVYGMAGIMLEICAPHPEIDIEIIPGVTAVCSGAALLGAPVAHDFAVISLSDMLTPADKIEKRLNAAAEADFAICLYNPGSKKRAGYLKRACDIILKYRNPETPCGIVENIGRQDEKHFVYTLGNLRNVKANMLTTVFIGNSQTKIINGRIVTPRGYKHQ